MSFNKKIIILILISILVVASVVGVVIFFASNSKGEVASNIVEEKDEIAPIIVLDDTYTIKTGYNGNLINAIVSVDDIDRNPKREIIGEYDLNKAGEYRLTYKITDASNNITTKAFTLRVRDSVVSEKTIKFEDAKDKMNQIETTFNRINWQSEAATAFKSKFKSLKNQITQSFKQIETEFAKSMQQTLDDMSKTEKANTVS